MVMLFTVLVADKFIWLGTSALALAGRKLGEINKSRIHLTYFSMICRFDLIYMIFSLQNQSNIRN